MPQIDLGCSTDQAQEQMERDQLKLPPGSYKMLCVACELGQTKKGRPQLTFELEVIEHSNPDFNGKKLFYYAPLPDGTNMKGIGFLVNITKALGKPWEGTKMNTEDYLTRSCVANVEPDGEYTKIKSFAY